jgi:hypothetical protein
VKEKLQKVKGGVRTQFRKWFVNPVTIARSAFFLHIFWAVVVNPGFRHRCIFGWRRWGLGLVQAHRLWSSVFPRRWGGLGRGDAAVSAASHGPGIVAGMPFRLHAMGLRRVLVNVRLRVRVCPPATAAATRPSHFGSLLLQVLARSGRCSLPLLLRREFSLLLHLQGHLPLAQY